MSFDVGDKVVYPHHGAAVVERRELKEVFGETREYLVLRLAYGDLTLMVPADNTDEVGLREVINDEEVEEVFAVLRKKEARMPTNWSRRYKNHVEKLKSGDIYQVAEVVRNLSIRDKDKGLSAGEKRMLNRARQILVSELTFAIGVSEEEAEKKLNEALPVAARQVDGVEVWAIVVAAGSGDPLRRGPSSTPSWPGRRVLDWSLAGAAPTCRRRGRSSSPPPTSATRRRWSAPTRRGRRRRPGPPRCGPGWPPSRPSAEVIVVHDAARPLRPAGAVVGRRSPRSRPAPTPPSPPCR